MSDSIENGNYYIVAAKGPTGDSKSQGLLADFPFAWVNYVILWGSYNYQSMDYIGYTQVHCDDLTEIFVGFSYTTYNVLAISCWTPPWYPQDYNPHIYNSVYIDAVYGTTYW
jgi:hypothetical protein